MSDYPSATPVPEVIVKLLAAVLPAEQRGGLSALVRRASGHSLVRPHMNKGWGELTPREQYRIAQAVGLAARDHRSRWTAPQLTTGSLDRSHGQPQAARGTPD